MALLGRFTIYTLISAVLSAIVIHHACVTRTQFYSAVIYLTTNRFSIVVLSNMALVIGILIARVIKTIFLGELRQTEVERVNDSLRYTIPEVCIAFTMFREELSVRILTLFSLLLFSKFFHVLVDMRMDQLEVGGAGVFTKFQHARLLALLGGLFIVDCLLVSLFAHSLQAHGHSVLMLFAFEYIVLALDIVRCFYRYIIVLVARRIQGEWPNKSLYLMYGKLAVDLIKLAVYFMYFLLLFAFYGMPIIMVRDLIRSVVDVNRELGNLLASRRLRKKIDSFFPPPTAEDLATQDDEVTCAVCFHDITVDSANRAKKLRCNHIFHTSCLLMWWERQQNCPVCRTDINAMMEQAEREQRQSAAAAVAVRAANARATPGAPGAPAPQPATPAPATAPGAGTRERHASPSTRSRRSSSTSDRSSDSDSSSASSASERRRARRRRHTSRARPSAGAPAQPPTGIMTPGLSETVAALQAQLAHLQAMQAQLAVATAGAAQPQQVPPMTPSAVIPTMPSPANYPGAMPTTPNAGQPFNPYAFPGMNPAFAFPYGMPGAQMMYAGMYPGYSGMMLPPGYYPSPVGMPSMPMQQGTTSTATIPTMQLPSGIVHAVPPQPLGMQADAEQATARSTALAETVAASAAATSTPVTSEADAVPSAPSNTETPSASTAADAPATRSPEAAAVVADPQ